MINLCIFNLRNKQKHNSSLNFSWMCHFHFECHLDVNKGDLMLLKEFKLREKRGGEFIFVSFRMVCQKTCQLKTSSRSCTSFHASKGRFQCCVVFCVYETSVEKACVKIKSIYVRKMRAHASRWKAVHLSLHSRDCGMHVKTLKNVQVEI